MENDQSGRKSEKCRFILDMRKQFFTVRMVRHWPRLPRAAVGAPSLAGLKARLDGAGSSLGWWKVPAHGRGLGLDGL